MQYVKDNSMQDELQTVKLCKIRYHSENSEIVWEVVWSGKSQGHQGQGHQDYHQVYHWYLISNVS